MSTDRILTRVKAADIASILLRRSTIYAPKIAVGPFLARKSRFGGRVSGRETYENGDETRFDTISLGCGYRRCRHFERYLRYHRRSLRQ